MATLPNLQGPLPGNVVPLKSVNKELRERVERAQKEALDERQEALDSKDDLGFEKDPEDLDSSLGAYVYDAFRRARSHKQSCGIDERLRKSYAQYHCMYDARELALLGGKETAVYWPLTNRLVRTFVAFLRKTLAGSEIEHPQYDLAPSVVPDPPPELLERAQAAVVERIVLALEAGAVITPSQIEEALRELADTLYENVRDEAFKSVRRAKREVDDALQKAQWEKVFDELLHDLVLYGTAIVYGPFPSVTKRQYFTRDKLKVRKERCLKFEAVDPFRFFPSSDSQDTQDGAYVIYLDRMSRKELMDARSLDSWDKKAIDVVLGEFTNRPRDWCAYSAAGGTDVRDETEQICKPWSDEEQIDVVKYYGCVPSSLLEAHGITDFDGREIEQGESFEVEIFFIGQTIVYVSCNIDPLCERPFNKAVLFDCPGSFWGLGAPDKIRDIQRAVNAQFRSMVRNGGFVSAPIFEIDKALLDKNPDMDIYPGKVFHKNSLLSSVAGQAIQVHQMDSRINEFMAGIAQLTENAEMILGLPRFLTGSHQGGGAARTLGGLQQLTANAAIQIRSSILNIDMDLLKPMIRRTHRWIVTNAEDPSLYADADVVTMGASALLSREVNKDRLLALIGLLQNFIASGYVRSEGVIEILAELLREHGLDPDRILVDKLEARRLEEFLRVNFAQQPGISGGVPSAALAGGGGGGIASSQLQADPGLATGQAVPGGPTPVIPTEVLAAQLGG